MQLLTAFILFCGELIQKPDQFKRNSQIINMGQIKILIMLVVTGLFLINASCKSKSEKQAQNKDIQQKVWLEKNKFVVIEVENADGGYTHTDWVLSTKPEGWTGTGYLIWKGDAIQGEGTEVLAYDDTEDSRKLTYHIQITNPGAYYIKVRNYHVGKGSGDHFFDGDNDCFISVNKSDFRKQYDHNVREFTWCESGNFSNVTLEAGVYEVAIGGRSFDFGADRIVLFHKDLAPEGDFGPSPHDWVNVYEWAAAPESEVVFREIE